MRLRIMKKAEEQRKPVQIDFSNDVVSKISNQKLIKLIHKLPYKLKQVIILRYLYEYSQEEVAQILHIPIGTVKSRIHAALKKLRQKEQVEEILFRRGRECEMSLDCRVRESIREEAKGDCCPAGVKRKSNCSNQNESRGK